MAQDLKLLKHRYSAVLARVRKGEAYLKRRSLAPESAEAADARMGELLDNLARLAALLTQAMNRELTQEESLEGFKE